MIFTEKELKNLYIIDLDPVQDDRGKFQRLFCKNDFNKIHHKKEILQINSSLTRKKGTIRGLHFQYPPKTEIKIIKCLKGKVFDVAVDIRKDSPTFLKWHGEILSENNYKMIYIPEGFAHGFQTLEDNCEMIYFHSEFYSPESEGSVRYNDPKINIKWSLEITDISKKDSEHKLLDENFEGIVI